MALNMRVMSLKAGDHDIPITGTSYITITHKDLDDYLNIKAMVWPKKTTIVLYSDIIPTPLQYAAFQLLSAEVGLWSLNYTWAFQWFRLALHLRRMLAEGHNT